MSPIPPLLRTLLLSRTQRQQLSVLNKAQEVHTGFFTLLINIAKLLFFEAVLLVYCSFHFILYKFSLNLRKRAPLLN